MKQECERVREELNRFLDGDLPAAAATDVASHLGTCVGCRHEYDSLKAVKEGLRAPVPISAERMEAARQKLFARLEQEAVQEATTQPSRPGWWTRISAALPRLRFGWQPALATVAAGGVLALLLLVPTGPGAGGTEITLPDTNEMSELYRLHDAHGGAWMGADPALHRDEAADAHAAIAGAQ